MARQSKRSDRPVEVTVVHSPDDGGYYAEGWHKPTGRTLYTTRVYTDPATARADCEGYLGLAFQPIRQPQFN
jgi:hypothetical protein